MNSMNDPHGNTTTNSYGSLTHTDMIAWAGREGDAAKADNQLCLLIIQSVFKLLIKNTMPIQYNYHTTIYCIQLYYNSIRSVISSCLVQYKDAGAGAEDGSGGDSLAV